MQVLWVPVPSHGASPLPSGCCGCRWLLLLMPLISFAFFAAQGMELRWLATCWRRKRSGSQRHRILGGTFNRLIRLRGNAV